MNDLASATIRKATPLTASALGGTTMVVWIEALAAVDDVSDPTSITVLFGPTAAAVARIRSSSRELTVIEVITPALQAGVYDVFVYRTVDPLSSAATFSFTAENAKASFDFTVGSARGGREITATLIGLPTLNDQSAKSFVPAFGTSEGRVLEVISSDVESAVFKVEVPPSDQIGEVEVLFSSVLYDTVMVYGSFTYYQPPAVLKVVPSFGPSGGGNTIMLFISKFPKVLSVVDVSVLFGDEAAVVTALTSDDDTTVLEVVVPRVANDAGDTEVRVIPTSIAVPEEREERTANFMYTFMRQAPAVEVSSNGNMVELQVSGFEPIISAENVKVTFGSMLGVVREVTRSEP
eukprot:3478661-Rhodomonas_salina.1